MLAGLSLVTFPLKHSSKIFHLSDPLAINIILLDSLMVFIPIVKARFGTSSIVLKNLLFAWIVSSVNFTFLVLEVTDEPGHHFHWGGHESPVFEVVGERGDRRVQYRDTWTGADPDMVSNARKR